MQWQQMIPQLVKSHPEAHRDPTTCQTRHNTSHSIPHDLAYIWEFYIPYVTVFCIPQGSHSIYAYSLAWPEKAVQKSNLAMFYYSTVCLNAIRMPFVLYVCIGPIPHTRSHVIYLMFITTSVHMNTLRYGQINTHTCLHAQHITCLVGMGDIDTDT